jgi:hypothetical protein
MENFKTKELLLLPRGIALTRAERVEMCRIIESAVKQIYGVKTFYHGIIEVDGVGVNYEYMSKAVNNRLLLKKIVYDDRGEIVSGVDSKEKLFAFVKANLNELFRPSGKYFRSVYNLLESASRKGDAAEETAFRFVEEMARKKGLQIRVLKPREIEEDVYGGIDGFFTYNDRNFTIQVKPLSENYQDPIQDYRRDPSMYLAYISGLFGKVKTDYLVLYDKRKGLCHMFRTAGITVDRSFLLIPKANEVIS